MKRKLAMLLSLCLLFGNVTPALNVNAAQISATEVTEDAIEDIAEEVAEETVLVENEDLVEELEETDSTESENLVEEPEEQTPIEGEELLEEPEETTSVENEETSEVENDVAAEGGEEFIESENDSVIQDSKEPEVFLSTVPVNSNVTNYAWFDMTTTVGSYNATINFNSKSYNYSVNLLYTTDLEKNVFTDVDSISSEELTTACNEGFSTFPVDRNFSYNYDKSAYDGTFGIKQLKSNTTYKFRPIYVSGSTVYFLTEDEITFTTKKAVEESKVTISDVKITGEGAYSAEISFKVNNPDNEFIVGTRVNYTEYSGSSASEEADGEYSYNIRFDDYNSEYTLTPKVIVYTGDCVETEIIGASVTVSQKEAEYSWDASLEVGTDYVTVNASLKDFYFVDRNEIGSAYFYYKTKDAQTYSQSYMSKINNGEIGKGNLNFSSINVKNLKPGTEYDWYIEVQTYYDYSYITSDVDTFKTNEEFELTEEHIPDANLRAALLGRVSGETLTNTNVESITYLNYSDNYDNSKEIKNLTGIKYAKNLTNLSFSDHDFSSGAGLDEIKELKKLQSLAFYECNLSQVPDLSGMEKLTSITFASENLSSLSGIEKAENLKYLTVTNCGVSDISAVAELEKIENLDLSGNLLKSLDVKKLPSEVKYLYISDMAMSSFPNLSSLEKLEYLYADNCGWTSIPEEYLPSSLKMLNINDNELTALPDLSECSKLTDVDVRSNKITLLDASYLPVLLEDLDATDNKIANIKNLDKLTALKYLRMDDNMLSSLEGISTLTNLRYVYAENNAIQSMPDLSGLNNLYSLYLDFNFIPVEQITEEKLPENFLSSNSDWIESTKANQSVYIEETKVSLDLTKVSDGYTSGEFKIKINNPQKEIVKKIYLEDENGNLLEEYSVWLDEDDTSYTTNERYCFGDATEPVNARIRAELYVKNKQPVSVYSEAITFIPQDVSLFNPTVKTRIAGNTVVIDVLEEDFFGGDELRVKFEYYKTSAPDGKVTKTTYMNGDGAAAFILQLEEKTAYTYSISYDYYGNNGYQSFGKGKTGSFTTEALVTYEDTIFPDETLRAIVKQKVSGAAFTNANLAAITHISYSSTNDNLIKDLTGIKYLKYLDDLYINNQEITSMDEVAELEYLRYLDLDRNDLKSFPDLSELTKLQNISLYGNLLDQDDLKASKLPKAFLEKNSNWLINALEGQRAPFSVRIADEYYMTGENTWAFIVGVNGIKKSQNYTFKVTIDGTDYTLSNHLSNPNDERYLIIKNIASTEGTKNITYSLTGADGIEYLPATTANVKFTKGSVSSEPTYVKSDESYVSCSVNIDEGDISALGTVEEAQLLKDGTALGSSNNIRFYSERYDNRYEHVFDSYLETGYKYQQVSINSLYLAKYLKSGTYDIKLIGTDGSMIIEDVVIASGDCIIQYVDQYTAIDSKTGYVYVRMSGYNVDPEKIHPEFTYNGTAALEYAGVANLSQYYDDEDVYYKYKKIGDIWNGDTSVRLNYTFKTVSGFDYIDNTSSDTVYFRDSAEDLFAHFNYKKGVVEVKMHSSVPEGTEMKISLMDEYDYEESYIYASGTGTVQNGWASFEVKDANGEVYYPEQDMYCYIYFEMYRSEDDYWENWSNWHELRWYNYEEPGGYGDPGSYLYVDAIRTTDTSFMAEVYLSSDMIESENYNDVKLVLYDQSGTVVKTVALDSTKEIDISKKITLESGLAEGYHTLELQNGEETIQITSVPVYDKDKFYIRSQSGYVEEETLYTYFYSDQVYAEYYRESGKIDMYDADDYTLTLYDRVGNVIKSVKPTIVKTGNNASRVYMSTTVPDGYAGFYAKIERNGLMPLDDFGSSKCFYNRNSSSYHKEYGRWIEPTTYYEGIDYIVENEFLHGIIGVYGNPDVTYPVTLQIFEASTDMLKKEIVLNSDSNYYFTASDVKDLKTDEIYELRAVSAKGKGLGSEFGYVVHDSSRVQSIPVTGIKLNETALTLGMDEENNSAQLSVTYTPSNANTGLAVTWSTSNEAVATVANGLVTANGLGEATITATTANGKKATCTVKVQNYAISETELVLNVPETKELTVTDGISVQKAAWTTSNEAVASVDTAGKVTAVGKGTAIITATLGNGMEFTCNVTVTNELKSISFQKTEGILEIGSEDVLEVTYMPASEAENYTLTWTSSDETVATVANGVVKALAEGSVTITASTETTLGVLTATCTYEVKKADVAPPIEDEFFVYAFTNVDTTLADLQSELPEGWEWVAPTRTLSAFNGKLEKDFAVQYVNDNTGEILFDEVTVKFAAVTGVKFDNLPAKLVVGVPVTSQLSYEVLGEELTEEIKNSLSWSVSYAPKAKTDVVEVTRDGNLVTMNALKAGSTTVLVELKSNDTTIVSYKQKLTAVANKAGVANVNVVLLDAQGNTIEPVDGVYVLKTTDQVYLKDLTEVSDVTAKAFKITYKSLDTAVIKVGKADKLDSTKTPITMLKAGTAIVTATANDTVKSAVKLQFKVEDRTAAGISLSETAVTLNTSLSDHSAEVKVYNGFNAKLTAVDVDPENKICDVTYDEDGTIAVSAKETAGKGGTVSMNVTVSDGVDTVTKTLTLKVTVVSKKPSVIVKQLTKLNTFYSDDEGGILSVGIVGGTISDVKLKETDFGYKIVNEAGQWKFKVNDPSKLAKKKCTLLIYVDGYQQPVEKAVTIATETLNLALSTTSGTVYGEGYMTLKTQVINKASKAVLNLMGTTAAVDNSNYTVEVTEYGLIITAKEKPAKTDKITLTLNNGQWSESKTFTFSVKAADASKAKLQLGAKSLTLYNYGNSKGTSIGTTVGLAGANNAIELMKTLQIVAADAKTRNVLNQTLIVGYDANKGEVVAKINGEGPAAGTYKVNLILKNDLWAKEQKVTLSIVIKSVASLNDCVTVKAKGTIDVLNRDDTSITLTPKFKNLAANMKVYGYALTGSDAHMFEVVGSGSKNEVTIRLKEDVNVITKYGYSVGVKYFVESGDADLVVVSAPVAVKLTQGKVKTTAIGAKVYSNKVAENKALNFVVTNNAGEKLEIEKVKLTNFTDDFSYDLETGKLSHKLNGETVSGKSYSLKFEIYLSSRGDNEKPVTVTYKVQIAK